ncbi:MAG TPA: hypothetical protein VFE61_02835 [Candidatus Sulfotelmatobacter sp.]|nr:hypothetical protein [Candidatus Sulfotelmatobacter sp.]
MTPMSKGRKGAMIAILAATGSVVGFTAGHVSIPISIGIAVIGIVIGTGVARGFFSTAPESAKKN